MPDWNKIFFLVFSIAGIGLLLLGLSKTTLLAHADTRGILFAIGAPLAILALEIVALGWKESSLRRIIFENDKSQRIDLLFFVLHVTSAMTFLTIIFSLGCSYFLGQAGQLLIYKWTGLNLRIDTGYGILNFAIYYIIFSFLEYWSHRLFHTGPFWNLHRLHHSATSLNPLVMHRAHPANLVLDPLLRTTLPLALVAAPGPALAALFMVTSLHQLLVHSSATWDWGWFGKWVLLSPAAHKIHHSIKPEHYGKNLSTDLVIWDHLFGTWYAGDVPVGQLGVTEGDYHKRHIVHNCIQDLRMFLTALLKRSA